MLPVIALLGRPNVGKSTLFNALTRTRDALVADFPGLTRDRQYGLGKVGPVPYILVDTGGLVRPDQPDQTQIEGKVTLQALQAVGEADALLLLVDGRTGLTASDQDIVAQLRRYSKPIYLVINKTEFRDPSLSSADFHVLGFDRIHTISATHRRGINTLIETVLDDHQAALDAVGEASQNTDDLVDDGRINLAIVGRPNVGKSTLINRLLGEERVLAFDEPGTTRDSVEIAFSKDGTDYTLVDTAGVRRRSRVHESIEKFSVIKTLQAIEKANVVLMMVDARLGIGEQDATLLGYILDRGRALVLAVNKWDGLETDVRNEVRRELDRRLAFLDFAETHFISALHGSGLAEILRAVNTAYTSALRRLPTPELTRILERAVSAHQAPLVHGHSIKLRYAHQGGHNPPLIIIHGNRTKHVPEAYRRYLINTFRKRLKLRGTPVRIEFRSHENPYQPTKTKKPQQHRPDSGRRQNPRPGKPKRR